MEGMAYFEAAAQRLASLLDTNIALITRLDPARSGELRTIALVEDGARLPDLGYFVHNTPCADVVDGRSCIAAHGVPDQDPANALFAEKAIEAHAGEPLRDHAGRLLGHVCVMSRRPFMDAATVATTLKMFSIAIAAEIVYDRDRRQDRDLFEFAPGGMLMIDRQGRVVLANRGAEQPFGWTRGEMVGQPVEMLLPPALHDSSRPIARGIPERSRQPRHGRRQPRPAGAAQGPRRISVRDRPGSQGEQPHHGRNHPEAGAGRRAQVDAEATAGGRDHTERDVTAVRRQRGRGPASPNSRRDCPDTSRACGRAPGIPSAAGSVPDSLRRSRAERSNSGSLPGAASRGCRY